MAQDEYAIECSQDSTMDLGSGVTAAIRRINGVAQGAAYWHPCNGEDAYGFVHFNQADDGPTIKNSGWDLISESPLTLSPSLLCQRCGHHGFIREGKWVTA